MSKYDKVIEKVFLDNFTAGALRVSFGREELAKACVNLGFDRIKNLGDIPYSYRFRKELPSSVKKTAAPGNEWIIAGGGIALYEFRQASPGKIETSADQPQIKILDATPEMVRHYTPGTDEQALLARVRYNRLVDLFTGLTCYSIQSHLRTAVKSIGQIEVDEIYLGVNKDGERFALPCQAKSPGDKFGVTQVMQDMALCEAIYPGTICKPIGLQFLAQDDVAIIELAITEEDEVIRLNVVDERRYELASSTRPANQG